MSISPTLRTPRDLQHPGWQALIRLLRAGAAVGLPPADLVSAALFLVREEARHARSV